MSIAITDSSGSAPSIPASTSRHQVTARIKGGDVWIDFNKEVAAGSGTFLQEGDSVRFEGERASAAVYMVTNAGETAILYTVNGITNMEITPGGKRAANGSIEVEIPPLISELNSSDTPLDAGIEFTGKAERVNGYGIIYINTYSDQASATDGLKIEQSSDGVNWDHCDEYSIPAATGKNFSINPYAKFMRMRYINGIVDQTQFRLQVILKANGLASSHRIQDSISSDDDASLVKAVISGQSPDGTFLNAKTNPESALSVTDFLFEVSRDNVPGVGFVHKFGRNPDIDGVFEAVWNGGGDYTGQDCIVAETLETFSSSADDAGALLSSGTATGGSKLTLVDAGATFVSDGVAPGDIIINDSLIDHGIITAVTETVLSFLRMDDGSTNESGNAYRVATAVSTGSAAVKLMYLLDGDYDNETSEYIILNGITPVDTVGTYIRHSRGRCFINTNIGAITSRQKTTTVNVTMVLPIGYNSTMIAAYTIPRGKRAFIKTWFGALAKKQVGFSNVRLMTRAVNDTYQVIEEFTVASSGTSYAPRNYDVPKDGISEMTDLKIMADASTTDMGVAGGFDLVLTANG